MKKSLLSLLFLGLLLTGSSAWAIGDVTIDIPLNGNGCIPQDTSFIMEIWFDHDTTYSGASLAFSLYSDPAYPISNVTHVSDPSGISAEFPQGTPLGDQSFFSYNGWVGLWAMFQFFYSDDWDGTLPDRFNYTGITLASWDMRALEMTKYIGLNLQIADPGVICLDSTDFENDTYDWLFSPPFSWGGEHCFCVGDTTQSAINNFDESVLPTEFAMAQNYPNPFNMSTKIEFAVPTRSMITVTVFNVLGQKVNTIFNDYADAGYHEAIWNGVSEDGTDVSSGLYFYKIEADNFSDTKKLMLLK